jgi:hypothetical protein
VAKINLLNEVMIMKRIMFALLLGAVIWILFSPPILADGGNRIRNVISIHDPTLEEHPWQELDGASPSLSDIALSNIRIATQDRVTTPPRNIIGSMLYIYFSIRFDFSLTANSLDFRNAYQR